MLWKTALEIMTITTQQKMFTERKIQSGKHEKCKFSTEEILKGNNSSRLWHRSVELGH